MFKELSVAKLSQTLECAFKNQQKKKHSFALDQKRAKKNQNSKFIA